MIDFSRAYARSSSGVWPERAELKDAAALSGKSIGVTRGAVEDMVLTSVAPQARRLRYEDNNTTLSAYLSGQVQYVATGNGGGGYLPAERRQSAGPELYAEGLAVKAIEQGIKDGTLNGLSEKWLKAPLPASLGA